MSIPEDYIGLSNQLDELSKCYKLICESLRQLKGNKVNKSFINEGEEYYSNMNIRTERIRITYDHMSADLAEIVNSYLREMDSIDKEERSQLEDLKISCNIMKMNKFNNEVIRKSEEYLEKNEERNKRKRNAYELFLKQTNQVAERLIKTLEDVEQHNDSDVIKLKRNWSEIIEEMKKKKEELNETSLWDESSFVYKENMPSKMSLELVKKYPNSYSYNKYMGRLKTEDGEVFIDCDDKNIELISKYINDDASLEEDIQKMTIKEKSQFFENLSSLYLPIKKDFIQELGRNEDNEIMEAWRERRVVTVNGKDEHDFTELLKKNELLDNLVEQRSISTIEYDSKNKTFNINLNMKYLDVIEDYLKHGKKINRKLLKNYYYIGDAGEIIYEMGMIGIKLNDEEKKQIRRCFDPRFLRGSTILLKTRYDYYLREWCGNYKWKMIYRASEYGYTAKSFHECCDDKGPTLIIIKSSGGWILGGLTTQSWKVVHPDEDGCIYYEMK